MPTTQSLQDDSSCQQAFLSLDFHVDFNEKYVGDQCAFLLRTLQMSFWKQRSAQITPGD